MADRIEIALKGDLGAFHLDVDLAVPMHGITALFGPSGCGKTSILRSVAGLNRMPGRIAVGSEIWQDDRHFVPTHKRSLGYVFQEASLFAHLSVRQNLTYGERRARADEKHVRFDDIVNLLGIAHLVDRSPANLSGGERQRVSIGRALLSQPRLLLMDEPLSALDRMAKDEILPYFEALHANLRIPILFVTHDIGEVERLADHLVLLREGRLVGSGPLNEVLSAPHSPLSARRDFAAVLPARVKRHDPDSIAVLDIVGRELLVVAKDMKAGETVRVRIAASDVSIAKSRPDATSMLNVLPARIIGIDALDDAEASIRLDIGVDLEAPIRARITRRSLEALSLSEGQDVFAQIKSVSLAASR
ncbi:molybdenum ABC transporter ATP-binding protein [Aliihoeflea aestuarii]|jgi:molybdate transport system ATP-binding protein|uniref:molybdenum ABC transporter ATP-binding protein n=1 Tax=Aliihoeflea aestuarii TaxID=453840 RepID=UPI002092CFF9|nr:molybdenum ABC transporter ATP-binding protein [Aliihoeflea aestuarii]MCO6391581.1 molybdenum ABC transporter ATP-binding protein [Aliihoeflea aestuarii]